MIITEDAIPYLVAQRGALDDMRGDWQLWCQKYSEMLESEFRSIEPFLPKECETILDIGGGIGGIDILINRHFGGDCQVSILDGIDDLPQMTRHSQTFNNFAIAKAFMHANGIKNAHAIDPAAPTAPHFFDLVISLKSWCFHYEPARYLEFVKACVVAGKTRIITDMRGGQRCNRGEGSEADSDAQKRYDWMRAMTGPFKHIGAVHYGLKFETHCFEAL